MAATFCMMAKVKGYKNVKMVKGTVPQANGKNSAHGWCEIKIGKTVYAYDPNFAYTYRNSNVKHHSGYKFTFITRWVKVLDFINTILESKNESSC